jgi:hypothetical protein
MKKAILISILVLISHTIEAETDMSPIQRLVLCDSYAEFAAQVYKGVRIGASERVGRLLVMEHIPSDHPISRVRFLETVSELHKEKPSDLEIVFVAEQAQIKSKYHLKCMSNFK